MTNVPDPAREEPEGFGRSQIKAIIANIRALENELEEAFAKTRADLRMRIENDRIVFEEQILKRHRELKIKLWDYIRSAPLLVVLTAPLIYVLIIPMVLLDITVSIYHAICFPVYGIKKVRRSEYIVFDRQNLAYLNIVEKLNCAYCSYANGLFAYVREIAARTEQYWCPIKHVRRLISPHAHYAEFVDYGDAEAYHTQLTELRRKLADEQDATPDPSAKSG